MRPIDQRADVVRHFNRFYTRRIGALGAGAPRQSSSRSPRSRVLYELAHGATTAERHRGRAGSRPRLSEPHAARVQATRV